jgi:hypothetical protein
MEIGLQAEVHCSPNKSRAASQTLHKIVTDSAPRPPAGCLHECAVIRSFPKHFKRK